ncbi:transmembrane protein 214-B, partial [Asbolus verrucosus]
MSGQWEVVGKKKDKGNKVFDQKSGKETIAKSQVRNLYLNDKNKENKPLEKKTQEVVPKKTQKKQEKSQEPLKAKSPKSLESALNHVSASEFKSIFEKSRSYFPDAPIVWLKELTQFLNQKVSVELQDPVFTTKPQSFPLSIVPSGIKAVIEKATMDADKSNMQLFFDISLTSMATDMSKNLPAVGHKLFLQYIALNEPSLVVANLMKHVVLRNSYQNRPNIGLSILWAVGQVGINDFQAGLKEISLTKEQYLLILETVFVAKKNFPSDLKQDLIHVIPSLTDSLFGEIHEEILSSLIEWSLKKITLNNNSSYQDCLCEVLIECFYRNQVSLENWSKIYNKNAPSSAILLKYI